MSTITTPTYSERRLAYTDSFEHSFDEKGRITVPREWRGAGFETRLVLLPGTECLRIFPASVLAEKMEAVRNLDRTDPRRSSLEQLATRLQALDLDSQHRMGVKEKSRKLAGIEKSAVLVGRLDHFEIWDAAAWSRREPTIEDIGQLAREAGL